MGYGRPLRTPGRFVAMYRDPDTRKCHRVPEGPDYYPTRHTAKLAGDAYEERLRGVYAGLGVEVPARRAVPTLAAYGPDAIRRTPDVRESTVRAYVSAVRMAVREHFGEGFRLDGLTPAGMERYYAAICAKGLAEKTRQNRIAALAAVARRAIRDGLDIPHPRTWELRVPEPPQRRRRLLADDELGKLVAAMPARLAAAVIVGHDCGLRVSELAGLTRDAIERPEHPGGTPWLWVSRSAGPDGELREYTKNGSVRRVPLSPRALRALDDHLSEHVPAGEDRLFWTRGATRPAGTRHFHDAMSRARIRAGIAPMARGGKNVLAGWHDLRRAFATKLYRAIRDPRRVQALMGHAKITMTMRYIQDFESEEANYELIANTFGGTLAAPPVGVTEAAPAAPLTAVAAQAA